VEDHDGVKVRPISEIGLGRMAKQREELGRNVAGAVKELEQLKRRQQLLEKEKTDLEELTRRQEEYERGKREILEKLRRSLAQLEKEELHSTRMAETIAMTRGRFKESLEELLRIDESSWPEEEFQTELTRALVLVEDARNLYGKGMARIEALGGRRSEPAAAESATAGEPALAPAETHEFRHWLKVGLALTLPLIAALIVLTVLWLALGGRPR
jgi:hypothetical protein